MDIIVYAGNAGDRNSRGMRGAVELSPALAERYGLRPRTVGEAAQPVRGGWMAQFEAATPNLRRLSQLYADVLKTNDRVVATMGRCAVSIATLPLIAHRFPDVAIVWFDAHGDCNLPAGARPADMCYLGGMVLTGAAGEWATGLGQGLDLANMVLVGARDLDPTEQARIDAGQIKLVPAGEGLGLRLKEALRGRRVYVHLDCDVLDEGLLATEYKVSDGTICVRRSKFSRSTIL